MFGKTHTLSFDALFNAARCIPNTGGWRVAVRRKLKLTFFQVDLLDTQLVANDVLVDELREHMDNLTLLLEEYKKAKPETPSKLAQQLQAQVDKYAETMKNKEQYFAESECDCCCSFGL